MNHANSCSNALVVFVTYKFSYTIVVYIYASYLYYSIKILNVAIEIYEFRHDAFLV